VTSLDDIVASPAFFADVNGVAHKISGAANEAETIELLREGLATIGAGAGVFASFIDDDYSHESYRFLIACDPVWCLTYRRRSWFANDPALLYAGSASEPCRLSELRLSSAGQRALMADAALHGFASGCVFPAPAAGGSSRLGVLVAGSAQPGFYERPGFAAIRLAGRTLAMELHEWWVRRVRVELIEDARLSPEDLELLRLESLGMGSKEIAQLLGMTPAGVDGRFRRLISRIGAPNRKAAVRVAMDYGII
jgi:DNA-binding CsgD family transcriptional regulator